MLLPLTWRVCGLLALLTVSRSAYLLTSVGPLPIARSARIIGLTGLCLLHSDCGPASYCWLNTCHLKRDLGVSCGEHHECSTGDCQEGVCVEKAIQPVPGGRPHKTVVHPVIIVLKPETTTTPATTTTAAPTTTSPTTHPTTTSHTTPTTAATTQSTTPTSCLSNTVCGGSTYCNQETNQCEEKKLGGSQCSNNFECTSNSCNSNNGNCECVSNEDCPWGSNCNAAVCSAYGR